MTIAYQYIDNKYIIENYASDLQTYETYGNFF